MRPYLAGALLLAEGLAVVAVAGRQFQRGEQLQVQRQRPQRPPRPPGLVPFVWYMRVVDW